MATPENEKKKDWLKFYKKLDREIDRECDELSMWKSRASKLTTTFSDMPRGGRSVDPLQESVERIIELENRINEHTDELIARRDSIVEAIDKIQDMDLQDVLKKRYIDGKSWPQVCTAIYGSRSDFPDRYDSYLRNIYRQHGRALSQVSLNVTIDE